MALVFRHLSIFNSKLLAIAHVIVISNSDKKFRAMMEDKKEDQLLMKTCFEKKLPLKLGLKKLTFHFTGTFQGHFFLTLTLPLKLPKKCYRLDWWGKV